MTESAPTPLVDKDGPPPREPVVWWSWLDGRYQIEVHRTGDYNARLLMWDQQEGMKLVLDESVGLAYRAMFGPDIDDVSSWEAKVLEVADARAEKEGS